MTNIIIRNEKNTERFITEAVTRYSFWNVYKPGCDEHVMVKKLRESEDFIPELDFVAECNGVIVGNVIGSIAKIYNENKLVDSSNIVCVGPICVLPAYQRQGIGSMLMEQLKKTASMLGYKGLVLYGNPKYYHRFGFVNANKYGITTPQGTNMEDFMILELAKDSLVGINGKCFESKAFEVSKEELALFEKKFILNEKLLNAEWEQLDYSALKNEFKRCKKEFPLKDEECIGLNREESSEITPCGTYCGNCDDYKVVCDGCRNRNGKPLWYDLYSKNEPCNYYTCTQKNHYHDCSQCKQLPCKDFFKYPDPNMREEVKQMWFKLRMENFYQINPINKIEIKESFKENCDKYLS